MFFLCKIKESMILEISRMKFLEQTIPDFFIGKYIKGYGLCIAVNSFTVLESAIIRGEGDLDIKVLLKIKFSFPWK